MLLNSEVLRPMAEDPSLQGYALKRGLNLRYCHLGSQEPSTQNYLKAAVAAHFSLDLGCSSELSGLRLPESDHPASLMRTCLQEPFEHQESGQFVYIQAMRTKSLFQPQQTDRAIK